MSVCMYVFCILLLCTNSIFTLQLRNLKIIINNKNKQSSFKKKNILKFFLLLLVYIQPYRLNTFFIRLLLNLIQHKSIFFPPPNFHFFLFLRRHHYLCTLYATCSLLCYATILKIYFSIKKLNFYTFNSIHCQHWTMITWYNS